MFKWVDSISEQNKKGLRVIRTILEVRGEKKFKYQKQSIEAMSKDEVLQAFSEGKDIDLKQTRDIFRRHALKSSYCT